MTTYEAGATGEPSRVAPLTVSPEHLAQIKAEAEDFAGGWHDGKEWGLSEGREHAQEELKPYLHHIGNCGAAGGDPEDSRCICGLRQVWMAS